MATIPKRLIGACVVMLLVLSPATAASARTRQKPLYACQYGQPIRGGYPCSEVDRALTEAAREFGISEPSFRRRAACESSLDPYAGRSFQGLLQQSARYGPGRMDAFDAANAVPLGGRDLRNPFINTRLSAWMLSKPGGARHWACRG